MQEDIHCHVFPELNGADHLSPLLLLSSPVELGCTLASNKIIVAS